MIERYSRPEMKRVWSDESKYDKWLLVELAVCEAWTDDGVVPEADMEKLREARYDIDRLNQVLKRTRHDMTAFLSSVTDGLGPEGRWLHLGLTTSDVWDTATSLQLMDAADLLDREIERLIDALGSRAVEHKDTLMMGRTHGVHAEPITFGLKLALWWDEMRRNRRRLSDARETIAVGKISGPVGTHATVSPSIETRVCRRLGIEAGARVQPGRAAGPARAARDHAGPHRRLAGEVRDRDTRAPEDRDTRGRRALPRGPDRIVVDAAQAKPGTHGAGLRTGQAGEGPRGDGAGERGAVGERDISHSSAERIILPDSCLALDYMLDLFTGVIEGLRVYPERMKRNMELTRGMLFSQRTLLALVERGQSREEAYELVQGISARTWDEGGDFRELVATDPTIESRLSKSEIEGLFDYAHYTRYVDEVFDRIGLR